MSGIAYNSSVVVYNKTGGDIGNPAKWYGVQIDKVRVELTQASNIRATGLTDSSVCTFKVHDEDLPLPYQTPAIWAQSEAKDEAVTFDDNSYFIIAEKPDMGISNDAPTGELIDANYDGGLIEHLKETYGVTYRVTTADHYSLVPHWEIGGK